MPPPIQSYDEAALDRFLDKIEKHPNGCWIWKGSINGNGYGYFHYRDRTIRAHRIAYKLAHPEFELYGEGKQLVLDHLCRRKHCVNPSHLEEVTIRTNTVRGKLCKLNETQKSKYTGVTIHNGRYMARISHHGKRIYLGTFRDELDAANAYQRAYDAIQEA